MLNVFIYLPVICHFTYNRCFISYEYRTITNVQGLTTQSILSSVNVWPLTVIINIFLHIHLIAFAPMFLGHIFLSFVTYGICTLCTYFQAFTRRGLMSFHFYLHLIIFLCPTYLHVSHINILSCKYFRSVQRTRSSRSAKVCVTHLQVGSWLR